MTSTLRSQLQSALGSQYTIERELGGGGMSRVFVATEAALGRSVVIKMIAPELAGGVSAERFAQEVKLAARLQQANIVPLHAAGDADGLPYYTMPFVRGESLRARIARGDTLPVPEAVSILRDVARALAYAHDEGVIHRDIKPENILLSGGTAVVTDFGIAKALSASRTVGGQAGGMTSGITQLGTSIGTPAYMAPEQAAGDPKTDHLADVYSWGVVAWELLGGRHPFSTKTTPQALLAAHMAETPESLALVRADVPATLTLLVARCLEKDPALRPASALELIAALDNVATPAAIGGNHPARRAWKSRRSVLAMLGAVAVLSAAAVAYRARGASADTASAARTIVVIPFDNLGATDDAYFADGVTEEIAGQLARIPGLVVVARASVKKFRGSSTPPQEIARQLGAAYALSGTVRWARSGGAATVRIVPSLIRASTGQQVWGEPLQENLADVFEAQADIAERVAGALSITIGASERATLQRPDSKDQEAREAVMLGFSLVQKRGAPNIKQAIVQFDRAIGRDSSYARAWAGRAEAYGLLPAYFDTTVNPAAAMKVGEESARRAVALDSLLSEAHTSLATVLHGRPKEALREVERAIALDPGSAMAQSRRGTLLLVLGRVAEVEAPLRKAVALDPLVAAHTARLGWLYMAMGRNDSTMAIIGRTREMDPTNSVLPYLGAVMYAHAGRVDEAIASCAMFGRLDTCTDLWRSLMDSKQRSHALALLDGHGKGGEVILSMPSFRALGYARLGASDSSFASLREALDGFDSNMMAWINSPWFTPMRADPRWDAIIGEMRRR